MNLQSIQHQYSSQMSAVEEGSWLAQLRLRGMTAFEQSGFPTTKQEHWKYTSTKALQELAFETEGGQSVDAALVAEHSLGQQAETELVFVNGSYREDLSRTTQSEGVEVLTLASALKSHPELVRNQLGRLATFEQEPDWSFTALNTAFTADGAFVRVLPNVETKSLIHILHIQDASGSVTSSHPRTLVLLERNSGASVFESFVSAGEQIAFTNAVTEITVGEGARLEHLIWANESMNSFHVGRTEVSVQKDARYRSTALWFGGRWSRKDTDVRFEGRGAEISLNGCYIGDQKQHIDNHTCVEHAVPNCNSNQLFRGVMGGESKAVFNGRIHIHADAQRSDSGMTNRNLLLTDKASVNSKPELEIYADDVKASHGTTVGQLDEQSIFYMRSRGLNRPNAERMLTSAFAVDVLAELSSDYLTTLFMDRLEARLNKVIGVEGDE